MTNKKNIPIKAITIVVMAVALIVAGVAPVAGLYDPATDGDVDPIANPAFSQLCGADVLLVVDNSASLNDGNLSDVKAAANSTVDVLAATDSVSSVGVISFNQRLDGSDGADTRIAMTKLSSPSDAQSVKAAIGGIALPEAETLTNWEAALLEASLSENDGDGDVADENLNKPADLVILVSDGRPNAYGYPGLNGTGATDSIEAATLAANVVKGEATRIIGVGFPDSNGNTPAASAFEAITDGAASTTGSADPQANDYYLVSDSADLSAVLTGIAAEFDCGIAVEKLNDADADDTFSDDETAPAPGDSVTYQVEVTNTGSIDLSIDDYSDDIYGSPVVSPALVGETLAAGSSTVVTFEGEAPGENGVKVNVFSVNASDEDGYQLTDNDDTTVRSPDLTPSIAVEKLVDANGDGDFADSETASAVGGTVTYQVTVANDGPNTVTIETYSDDIYGSPSVSPALSGETLAPGESITVTFDGTAPAEEEATKTNTFTVSAFDADGDEATDSDTATVVAPDLTPVITVEKLNDANADGSFSDDETTVDPGDAVTYEVTVTNDGPNTVTIDSFGDDVYDSLTLSGALVGETLVPGDSVTVTFDGSAPSTEDTVKVNTFTVSASDADGDVAADEDPTTVRSPDLTPSIAVEKLVDAQGDGIFNDSETASTVGGAVTYQVTVTNDGPNTVTIDSFNDDVYSSPTLSGALVGETLASGDSVTVTFEGAAPADEEATKTNTFTVSAFDADGDEATDSDTATVVAPDLTPVISVEKLVDANDNGTFSDTESAPSLGATVTYQVTVTNDGPNTVTIDSFSDDIYSSPTLSGALVGETLASGGSVTVTFDGTAPDTELGSKTNVFTVNASDADGDEATDSDDATVLGPDLTPQISVEKLVDADGDGDFADSEEANSPGDAVTYQVTVSNDGPNTVTINDYSDDIYGSPTVSPALVGVALAPGDSVTVTFDGTAPADEEATKTNTFTVDATDADGDPATDSDTATVVAPDLTPIITVEKLVDADGDETFADNEEANSPGDSVTYQVTVTNDGPNTVTIDSFSDDIYSSPTLSGALVGETLASGDSVTVTFEGAAPADEEATKTNVFTVTASDADGDVATDSDDATVVAPDLAPVISVEKLNDANGDGVFSDDETTSAPGDSVTYQVTVTNDGPNTVTIDSFGDDVYSSLTLSGALVGETLAPGDSVTVTFQGGSPNTEDAVKVNTFTVSASDTDGDVVADEDSTTVRSPNLLPSIVIEKLVDADDDGTFADSETASAVGGAVTYQVTVTNDGPNTVTIDSFSDDIYSSPTLSGALVGETLASGGSVTVTFDGTAPADEGATKTNVFTVTASDADGDEATDSDDATVVAPDLTPVITVEKLNDANADGTFSDDETTANPGDAVTYQVTVTNDGPNTVTIDSFGDDVYDSLTLSGALVGETLAPGNSVTVTFEGSSPSTEDTAKVNTFSVSASDADGDVASDEDPTTVRSPDLFPSIVVEKLVDAQGDGIFADSEEATNPDDDVTYQVTVTNDGPNTVTIDSFSDDIYGSPTVSPALVGVALAPGDAVTVTFDGTAPSSFGAEKRNVFTVIASDADGDEAIDSDDATVTTPAAKGICPRTPGFWSTHNGDYATGNNPDLTTELLPVTLGDGTGKSVVVDSDDVANAIFNSELTDDSAKNNGISRLYIHLLAAELNTANGAGAPQQVLDAIERSDEILTDYDESDWKDIKKDDKDLAQEIGDLKDLLDQYNNRAFTGDDCVEDWWKEDME